MMRYDRGQVSGAAQCNDASDRRDEQDARRSPHDIYVTYRTMPSIVLYRCQIEITNSWSI